MQALETPHKNNRPIIFEVSPRDRFGPPCRTCRYFTFYNFLLFIKVMEQIKQVEQKT
jgi:hypothetical protein